MRAKTPSKAQVVLWLVENNIGDIITETLEDPFVSTGMGRVVLYIHCDERDWASECVSFFERLSKNAYVNGLSGPQLMAQALRVPTRTLCQCDESCCG